jgi:hypothetical protein
MSVTVEQDGASVVVRIPMQIKKRCGRREVILPAGLDAEPQATTQEPLLLALSRAHLWETLIDSGKYSSIAALAEALCVDRSYVRRIISLTTLSPRIVEAIGAGTEPGGLSLERLMRKLPVEWKKQQELLGSPLAEIRPTVPAG